tara:strand:- start:757 stop:972 length:216 start_codon:yes stop_codon:yes gene_type:complete
MITIDGVEYTEEELSADSKIRANRIMELRSEVVRLILAQQEAEQNIMFHAQQIKEEMTEGSESTEAQVIED